jgi:hypothetical protein
VKTLAIIRCSALVLLVAHVVQPVEAAAPSPGDAAPAAPSDIVEIKVLSTHKQYSMFGSSFNVSRFKVSVVAKVTAIERTDTDLKTGAIITITYPAHTYNFPGWTGPVSIPILARKDVCKVHLVGKQGSKEYTPWGPPDKTFEMIKK